MNTKVLQTGAAKQAAPASKFIVWNKALQKPRGDKRSNSGPPYVASSATARRPACAIAHTHTRSCLKLTHGDALTPRKGLDMLARPCPVDLGNPHHQIDQGANNLGADCSTTV